MNDLFPLYNFTPPYGMQMPGRNTPGGDYRYGYNGMEMDNEVSDNGNSYTTEFRQYDPRLGRWKSLDPLMAKYPNTSPYVAFNNNPIYFTDPLGLEGGPAKENYSNTKRLYNSEINPSPKNVTVTETYSCDRTYEYELSNGEIAQADVREGDVRTFEVDGVEYKAGFNQDPKKAGEFTGYYSTDGKGKKFKPKVQYGYAWNYLSSDKTFTSNLGKALKHWYDNPDSYIYEDNDGEYSETGVFNFDNYNCWEFALSLTKGEEVDYDNIIENGVIADNILRNNYQNVNTPTAGKTVIRLARDGFFDDNITTHFAIYLGVDSNGKVIVGTKNGNDSQPRIMLLDDLLDQHGSTYGVVKGLSNDPTGYYNAY